MDNFQNLMGSSNAPSSRLVVHHSSGKDCWVALPPALVAQLLDQGVPTPLVLKLTATGVSSDGRFGGKQWHVGWGGEASRDRSAIEIPSKLAQLLDIPHGTVVDLEAVPDLPVASSVTVEPADSDDWELVELHAHHMEEQILNQMGMIAVGQPFPFWVKGQTALRLKASSAVPADIVRLQPGSEVAVAPRPRARKGPQAPHLGGGLSGFPAVPNRVDGGEGAGGNSPDKAPELPPPVWLRVQVPPPPQPAAKGAPPKGAPKFAPQNAFGVNWNDLVTGPTTVVSLAAQTAAAAGLKAGDTVLVTGSSRKRSQLLRVAISEKAAPQHCLLAPAAVAALQTTPCRHVELQAVNVEVAPNPWLVSLRPMAMQAAPGGLAQGVGPTQPTGATPEEISIANVQAQLWAGGPGPRGAGRGRNLALLCIKMLSPEALRELLASWLEAQAKAAGAPGQTVPLQDGVTATWVDPVSGSRATFSVHLQHGTRPNPPAEDGLGVASTNAVLLSADQIGAGPEQTKVEIGNAVPEKEVPWASYPPPQMRSHPAWLRPTARAALRAALPLLSTSGRARLDSGSGYVPSRGTADTIGRSPRVGGKTPRTTGRSPRLPGRSLKKKSPAAVPPAGAATTAAPAVDKQPAGPDAGGQPAATTQPTEADVPKQSAAKPDAAKEASGKLDMADVAAAVAAATAEAAAATAAAAARARAEPKTALVQPGAGILLAGGPGTGKTAAAAWVAEAAGRAAGCRAHTTYLDCRLLAGETPADQLGALMPLVAEAVACMPSLLILDSIEVLCPSAAQSSAEAAGGAGGQNVHVLANHLARILDELRDPRRPPLPLVVVGTCKDASEVAEPLRAAGRLDVVVCLPTPGAEQRAAMLAADLEVRGAHLPQAELQAVAAQMEGYDAADMAAFLDRALHSAARRTLSAPPDPTAAAAASPTEGGGGGARDGASPAGRTKKLLLTADDVAVARKDFSPAAFWGVGKPPDPAAGIKGWGQVGGLPEVKAALREALELPARAPTLVASAPLRLRTGALLYGPPGCGKTHVVRCAAAAAGLRLISVSGPEVLNKYIGQSEAAVRDLFRRAAGAAPCVLFFDEFDSIAPQRGHDSTGVTDRVVNQLLTELDGVEGLKGVAVVGATSRPDLLDAALLRPGRLDRLLLCGLPEASDRAAILKALAQPLKLADDVNLDAVAAIANHFTGADLGALLSEAQLAAAHEVVASHVASGGGREGEANFSMPIITGAHLSDALAKARPSVSPAEMSRLSLLYARFRGGRDPAWTATPRTARPGQLTTMA